MKRIFSKVKFDGRKQQILDLINENREQIIYETFIKKKFVCNSCNTNLFL